MMANLRRLQRYDPAATLARPAARTVAWLTGQSSFCCAQLSPAQAALLQAVSGLGWVSIGANFPYNEAGSGAEYQEAPLLLASLRNGAQFGAALGSAAFGRACARHLQPLLEATAEQLVLLCGSCGWQLFWAAWPWLRVPPGLRIRLVGLGAVGRSPRRHPQVSAVLVRGRHDWLSRALGPQPCHYQVPGGHLDYAARPEVARLLKHLLISGSD